METVTVDDLEAEHGTAILSDLCGLRLIRNPQPVRLFDQTKHSSEFYFRSDKKGKPYIQNFQEGKRYYPLTAYCQVHNIDFATARKELILTYYGERPDFKRPTYKPIRKEQTTLTIDYLPIEHYTKCQSHFERNGLFEYLRFTYGHQSAMEVFNRYRLGASRRWRYYGYLATCLPQFDKAGNLRQVKIMPFDAMNGRRVKKHQEAEHWNWQRNSYEPTSLDSDKIYFAGKQLAKQAGKTNVNLQQCFFGEHLLAEYLTEPVAIVEGESTAIVCSIIWPQYVWLASGGSNGCRWSQAETFSVLQGRNVILWPDTGKYDEWSQKAHALRPLVQSIYVSDYVEKHTPLGMGNVDLRDLLTRPYYIPKGQTEPIYGEVLYIEPCDYYPPEWDEPTIEN